MGLIDLERSSGRADRNLRPLGGFGPFSATTDKHGEGRIFLIRADLTFGQPDEAGESLARLLIQARADRDLFWETRLLREIGHLDLSRDRHHAAAEWYGRSLDLALTLGRSRLIAQGYNSLAEALAPVEPIRAIELAELGVEHATAAGAAVELGKVRTSIAEVRLALGDLQAALSEASASLTC